MINNIQFKIIARKINKIAEFYTIFARKMRDYIIRQRDRGQAEAKSLRLTVLLVLGLSSRPTCPQDICSRSTVRASDTLISVFHAL